MKVHVVLQREIRTDSEAKQAALKRVMECGLTEVNQKRFERHGIVSGEISPDRLAALREALGV